MSENKAFEMETVKGGLDYNTQESQLKKPASKKTTKKQNIKNLLICAIWIVVFEGIGAGLGIAFGTTDWYDNLNLSPLTPPGVVFSIVWPVLYAMLAIYGWWNSNNLKETAYKYLFFYFWFQMVLNWMWTPVYFGWHETVIGLVLLVITVVTVLYMVVKLLYLKEYVWSAMLVPYLLWCSFATYLNAYTVAEN